MQPHALATPRHFDLCIIGAGSGNSIIDERFDGLEIALVDKGLGPTDAFGGTCLNVGCIPTKMFVVAADLARVGAKAGELGVTYDQPRVDFPAIRDRIFGRIDPIAADGLAWRESNANVTVYRDAARFINATTLRVGADVITADRFVLAAGSRPHLPRIEGLDDPYLASMIHTSESIMRIEALPERMVIIGGGMEAAEFAHVFSAFGVDVTIVVRSDQLLRRADRQIAERFTELMGQRVGIRLSQSVRSIEASPEGGLTVVAFDPQGMQYTYDTDLVLVTTGRVPNADTLAVERAGVTTDARGFVVVDEHQRTNLEHIWALGDICSPWMLKHVANHEARVVAHNLLNPDDLTSADHRFVPYTVFTEPEIASVGPTEEELVEAGSDYVAVTQPYSSVAYGWALEDDEHFVKLLVDPASGHLLAAHIIGPQACALMQPVIQALHFPVPVDELARGQYWVHPGLPEVLENALLAAVDAIAAR